VTTSSGLERSASARSSGGPSLRIAFFTDTFLPTHDGVAGLTAALADELTALGHEITVFTVRSPEQKRRERLPNGVTVYRHLALAAPSYPQYRVALLPYAPIFLSRRQFDLVHIHTPGFVGLAGFLAARRWDRPTVGTFHSDLQGMLAGAGKTRAVRAFFRAWARFNLDLCLHCDRATAPTTGSCEQLTHATAHALRRPPVVIENGVDVDRFRPGVTSPDWHARLGVPSNRPLVTFLGRLTRDKGALRFLDAMEGLPPEVPSFAVVGGSGPLRPEVAARFGTGAPIRGRYVGPVVEEEKAALLAQSYIFVLPSLSDTSSVALLEAMACGAACVVTNRGGPAEIAQRSGAATVVDPEDTGNLRAAIHELLVAPDRAAALAERGLSWVRDQGSISRTAWAFDRLYRELLAERPIGQRGDLGG
jgi:1,2-diacylglycerol 3-alpha-glucosyltransferase